MDHRLVTEPQRQIEVAVGHYDALLESFFPQVFAPQESQTLRAASVVTSRVPSAHVGHSRRQRLIYATIAQLRETGIADTTPTLISRRAGFPVQAIGYHFGSYHALLQATVAQWVERVTETVEKSSSRHNRSSADALDNLIADLFALHFDQPAALSCGTFFRQPGAKRAPEHIA